VIRTVDLLPEGFGAAVRDAHSVCEAAVAAARETWLRDGDDRAYLATVREACYVARRALDDACYEPRQRSRGMDTVATYIAAPYSLEQHVDAARDEVFAAMRVRARAAVGVEVCERIDAVHAATQQRMDAARDAYRAGGEQRVYLDAIRVETREAQRELDVILADLGDGVWPAADQPRLDAYGYRATEDQHQRYIAERDARRARGAR
jgi:hypothetical protein